MQMSKIVRLSADIMYPFVVIFGLYVIMHGHITPGGGFQGGAVVATGAALVIVAYALHDVKAMIPKVLLYLQESMGLLLFIGAGLAGMLLAFPFFFNWLANSGSLFGMPVPFGPNPGELNTAGFLPIMNIAVGIEVWGGLTLILLYMLSGVGKEGY
ncbi:MAG: sodium:proton antiporter [Methanomicrobiales archaeon]|jgi:multicomponent Na+:H+ antiporter subunit B|nr:sodium:proton antiporter [Methanomicrobiales archaeon]